MSTRVTFRLADELATELRKLPNQTVFVEKALRDALGKTCPLCHGRGRLHPPELEVSDFRRARLPRLSRERALALKRIVRVGRDLSATQLSLSRGEGSSELSFALTRRDELLLSGPLEGR